MFRTPLTAAAFLAAIALTSSACTEQAQKRAGDGAAAASEGTLVVYCGRSESLVGDLLKKFEEETGTKVEVRWGKTPQLATRLATEGETTEADVFFAQDSGYLGALADHGILAELPDELVAATDESMRAPSQKWLATSGRARVLVYNPETVKPADLPATLKELANPRWAGKLGWAPTNGSCQAHVSALRHLWGEAETEAWLEAIEALGPKRYPKNSPQVIAAAAGEIQIGWVNHYYLHKLRAEDSSLTAANWSFPTEGDAGNLIMLSGAAITSHAKHPNAARQLLAFLVSESAQTYFAQKTFEYPTRPGVPTHPDVPPLASVKAARVDQAFLTDVGPTVEMLQRLGLVKS